MPTDDRDDRTRLLARIFGPYLVVVAAMLIMRRDQLATIFPAFMRDEPLTMATGAFTLMAGLAILAVHHRWRGASAIAVSLIGVAAAGKGAWLLIAPGVGAGLVEIAARPPVILPMAALAALAGLWLSAVGWRARSWPDPAS